MTLTLAVSGALPLMNTTTTTTDPAAAAGAAVGGLLGLVIGVLITGFALMGIFKKAGRPAWAAFVPIYNVVVLLQICGLSPLLILLYLIPVLGPIVLFVLVSINLAKVFGKGVGTAVLNFFFTVIMYFVLSYGSARYLGPDAARHPFGLAPNAQAGAYQG